MTRITADPTSQRSDESFPRQRARTRMFTCGVPRTFRVDPAGERVLFVRSRSGDDPVGCLWSYAVATKEESLLADPRQLLSGTDEALPAAERARRERAREIGSGIVGYATDTAFTIAAFALSGALYAADLTTADVAVLPAAGPVIDPRPDPTGRRIAYVTGRALHVLDRGGADRRLAAEDDADVSWGLAEFVAAEEMGRLRGYWWSPDGDRMLAARVDESAVVRWHINDPATPESEPAVVRYPVAGSANADVSLAILSVDGDGRVDIGWDRAAFPYLVDVGWSTAGLLLVVQSRDQRTLRTLQVEVESGETSVLDDQTDDVWVELVTGVPRLLPDGRLVTTADSDDTRRLCVNGVPVTPVGLQVMSVNVDDDVVFVATEDPAERHVWRLGADGEPARLTREPGVHAAARGGDLVVVVSTSMDRHGPTVTLVRGEDAVGEIASYGEQPQLTPSVTFLTSAARQIRTAVLLPSGHQRGTPLPVLLDPYGGPHGPRVVRSRNAHLVSQWFADQGFAVVVADGRGTPARGPTWERAIHDDWAAVVVEDQVEALQAAAESVPDMDLGRVAIRGWSFGGYLAGLAVLRRPDVFHAAVAGAPVADWQLYDTHYTERYLGLPQDDPERYAAASLMRDAARLRRPLLLVHGLADDNVVVAHTLRFSGALLAAGRPHTVLPLTGITHMTSEETVAENLFLLEVDFLRGALNLNGHSPGAKS